MGFYTKTRAGEGAEHKALICSTRENAKPSVLEFPLILAKFAEVF
jgi:hypothetical protein